MSGNLYSLFRAAMPGEAARFIAAAGGRELTYGEMDRLSARIANALIQLGVAKGDRVAAQVEKSPEALVLFLAALRAGAVYLPLNPDYTRAELEYFVSDSEPKVLVVPPRRETESAQLGAGATLTLGTDGKTGTLLARAGEAPAEFSDAKVAGSDLAAILYTSGTTGRSKGAMLSHGNLESNALALKEVWRFTKDDVLLHALPLFHTHGLFVASNVILAAGASMIFTPKFDPGEIIRLLPRATAMMGVPTFYVRLLRDPRLTRELAAHMRLFTSGSAPLLAETHREWQARTGHAILERYGMTETNMNTSNPYDGERVPGTVGFALPGVRLRITDPASGGPLPAGKTGMIEVAGPNVFSGYWRMADKTAEAFRKDGYFITGDLGRIDARGYVHIAGRDKDLIISGGFNVYPKEVESEIDALEGVVESAVIGAPHRDFGEAVTAAVVCETDARLSEEAVIAALRGKLAGYKLPKRVLFIEELPRNAMGKVQKNVLRDNYREIYA